MIRERKRARSEAGLWIIRKMRRDYDEARPAKDDAIRYRSQEIQVWNTRLGALAEIGIAGYVLATRDIRPLTREEFGVISRCRGDVHGRG